MPKNNPEIESPEEAAEAQQFDFHDDPDRKYGWEYEEWLKIKAVLKEKGLSQEQIYQILRWQQGSHNTVKNILLGIIIGITITLGSTLLLTLSAKENHKPALDSSSQTAPPTLVPNP